MGQGWTVANAELGGKVGGLWVAEKDRLKVRAGPGAGVW